MFVGDRANVAGMVSRGVGGELDDVGPDEGELVASIRIPHTHIVEAEALLTQAADPFAVVGARGGVSDDDIPF